MGIEEIRVLIKEHDRKARKLLGLEPDDDWCHFTSECEHPELFKQQARLKRDLVEAREAYRVLVSTQMGK